MDRTQRIAAWLLVLILTGSGLACTPTRSVDTNNGSEPFAEEACFNVRNVDSFSPLHGRFVYVRLVDGQEYLLTLDNLHTSLPFATGITISGVFARVCLDTGAMITFTDSGRPAFCRIVRVEAVASKEAARKPVADRGTAKPKG